MQKWT